MKQIKLFLFLAILLIFTSCSNNKEELNLNASITVNCETVFDNMDKLKSDKEEIIPKDGIIFTTQTAKFKEGDTVLDLIIRQMKDNNMHFSYKNIPGSEIAFVEAIGNLYTFDCGEESGWIFKINDEFPLEGCNQIKLKDGDKIEFLYTCDWGIDIGAYVPE